MFKIKIWKKKDKRACFLSHTKPKVCVCDIKGERGPMGRKEGSEKIMEHTASRDEIVVKPIRVYSEYVPTLKKIAKEGNYWR